MQISIIIHSQRYNFHSEKKWKLSKGLFLVEQVSLDEYKRKKNYLTVSFHPKKMKQKEKEMTRLLFSRPHEYATALINDFMQFSTIDFQLLETQMLYSTFRWMMTLGFFSE